VAVSGPDQIGRGAPAGVEPATSPAVRVRLQQTKPTSETRVLDPSSCGASRLCAPASRRGKAGVSFTGP
jgi:hypothetical protein